MCLKKRRFLDMLAEFPDALRFYIKRSQERRIEFRRVRNLNRRVALASEEARARDRASEAAEVQD